MFQAVEKLATWRRTYGYDRLTEGVESWILGTRPLTPEEFTASLWEELNALKDAISMSGRTRPWKKAKEVFDELEQGKTSLTDAKFAMFKRFVERRSHDAAHATVASIDTALLCTTRSPSPKISIGTRICMESNEGKMDPEPDQLDSPSAGTGLETPGQQCPPNGETGPTTADGCLLVDMGLNSGGNAFFPAEIAVGARPDSKSTTPPAGSNTISLKASRKPEDEEKGSEENKQFDPGGKGEKPPPWNAAVMVLLSFPGGTLGMGSPLFLLRVFVCVCLSICFVSYCQVIIFSADKIDGDTNQVGDERSRRASIFLPINPLKIITTDVS